MTSAVLVMVLLKGLHKQAPIYEGCDFFAKNYLQTPKEKIHDFYLRPTFLVGCSHGDQGRGLRFSIDGLLQRQRYSYSMVLLLPDHCHWMDFRYVFEK